MVDRHFSVEPPFKVHPTTRLFASLRMATAERNARDILMAIGCVPRLLRSRKNTRVEAWSAELMDSGKQREVT
jgi:hypothetical protein